MIYRKVAKFIVVVFISSICWNMAFAVTNAQELPETPEAFKRLLTEVNKNELAQIFQESIDDVNRTDYWNGIVKLEAVDLGFPDSAYVHWRLSRLYWVYAENLPVDAKSDRLIHFENSKKWAEKGIEINPECAECYLYKFSALGRIGTTKGLLKTAKAVPEMARLIDKTILLNPQHYDSNWNIALGNAYYARAVFYRLIPDWFWVGWVLGVKGDIERSLQDISKAIDLAPMRIDYQVELGATYLCYAQKKKNKAYGPRGIEVLQQSLKMPSVMETDKIDKYYAKILIEKPKSACGFSRDGIVDWEKVKREEVAFSSR